jgi:hypothetical protein
MNIGDKVKIVSNARPGEYDDHIGRQGVIVATDSTELPFLVKIGNCEIGFEESELEVIA